MQTKNVICSSACTRDDLRYFDDEYTNAPLAHSPIDVPEFSPGAAAKATSAFAGFSWTQSPILKRHLSSQNMLASADEAHRGAAAEQRADAALVAAHEQSDAAPLLQ